MFRTIFFLLICNIVNATGISGGLEFGKPKLIKIKRQDLVISPSKVTVYYVFKNTSSLERIETLLFELPEDKSNDNKGYHTNLTNFSIMVNGMPISYQKEIRAYNEEGIEISDMLKKFNLSLDPLLASSEISERAQIDSKYVNELDKYNLLNFNKNKAKWKTKTFYYWQQKFPAFKEVHVKQVYSPSVDISPGRLELIEKNENKFKQILSKIKRKKEEINDSNIFEHVKLHTERYATNLQHFCFKDDSIEKLYEVDISSGDNKTVSVEQFKNVLNTFWDKHSGKHKFLIHELSYGLLKDAHWSGPIEKFTLRIEYPKYITPVFCWGHDLVQKDNTIISQINNFMPLRNVNILFFEKIA